MELLKREQLQTLAQAERLFPLGHVCITPAAAEVVTPDEVTVALVRHGAGDWGNLSSEDAGENVAALLQGARLLSSYRAESGPMFWVITEADRSVTTVLLPQDY